MTKAEPPLIDRLLVEGLVDWLDPGWISGEAYDCGIVSDGDFRTMTVGAAAELLLGGLAVAGDVTEQGFEAWPTGPEQSLARITDWIVANPMEEWRPGEGFWLNITVAGETRGKQVPPFLGSDDDGRRTAAERAGRDLVTSLLASGRGGRGVDPAVMDDAAHAFGVDHPEDRQCFAMGAIARLLLEGLAVAGTRTEAGGFRPWSTSPPESIRRIFDERRSGRGAAFWLHLTERGDAAAVSRSHLPGEVTDSR